MGGLYLRLGVVAALLERERTDRARAPEVRTIPVTGPAKREPAAER